MKTIFKKMRIGGLALSTLSGLVAKVTAVLVMVALVPLAQGSLSTEGFGVWMTLTSLLVILQLADFGIGNGLVTVLSSHLSDKTPEILKTAVSTATVILITMGGIIFLVTVIGVSLVGEWVSIFKVADIDSDTIRTTLLLFTSFIAASIPAVIGQKILWGFQETYIANIWQIVGSVLTLLLFAMVVFLGGGLVWLVSVTVLGPLAALVISSVDQFIRRRAFLFPRLTDVRQEMGSRLLRLGGAWSVYQALFFAATSADAIFVTRVFGVEAMGTYGIMMRMMNGLSVALFFTVPLWPIFSGAIARNDRVMIKRYCVISLVICGSIGVVTALFLFFLAQPIARIWVGSDFVPGMQLVISFSAWTFIYNLWAGISSLMGNEMMIRRMVLIAGMGCLIAVFLKIPLANTLGTPGVCWASVIGIGFSSLAGLVMLIREFNRKEPMKNEFAADKP